MKPISMAIAVGGLCGLWSMALADEPSGTTSDVRFVAKVVTCGSTEIELARMAVQRAKHADLKAFAHRVITDHAAANTELLALAGHKQIPVPKTVDSKQQELIARLAKLSGEEFDRAFAFQMVKDHKEAVDLFRSESEHGTDPDLKSYATKVLPILEKHLSLARELTGDKSTESKSVTSRPTGSR